MEPTISRKIIDDSWPRRWNICSIKESTKKTPNNINTTCRIETPQLRKIQLQRWELLVELLLLSCQRFWSLSTSRPSIDSQTVHNIWRITLNSFFPYLAGNNNKKIWFLPHCLGWLALLDTFLAHTGELMSYFFIIAQVFQIRIASFVLLLPRLLARVWLVERSIVVRHAFRSGTLSGSDWAAARNILNSLNKKPITNG